MVDVASVRQQIATGRQQISSARQQTQSARQVLSQRQLRGTTREQRLKTIEKFKQAKEEKLKEIKGVEEKFEAEARPIEKQITDYEAAVVAQQAEQSQWEAARKLVARRGGDAIRIAKGSEISAKVKQLVEGGNLEGTTTGQVSVADFQARKKALEEAQQNLEIEGGIVSESIYKDLQKRSKAGDKISQETLGKVGGYIPQANIDELSAAGIKSQKIKEGSYPYLKRVSEIGTVGATLEKIQTAPTRLELKRQEKVKGIVSDLYGGWTKVPKEIREELSRQQKRQKLIAKSTGTALSISTYGIPGVGEAFLIGGGTEKYSPFGLYPEQKMMRQQTKEWFMGFGVPEKVSKGITYSLPAAEIGLGIIGVAAESGVIGSKTAIKQPKKLTGESVTTYQTKVTSKNIGRFKKVYEGDTLKGVVRTKGGQVTQVSSFKPTTYTRIRGKGWKELQIAGEKGDDIYGVITKSRGIGRKPFEIQYTISKGEATYNIYKGKKLLRTLKKPISSEFGYTELTKVGKETISRKITFPTKQRLDIKLKGKVMRSELVKTGTTKIKGTGEYRTISTEGNIVVTNPAQKSEVFRWIKGEDKYTLKSIQSTKTGKFSKVQPSDIELIKGKVISKNMVGVKSMAYETPRFTQYTTQELKGFGKFTIQRDTYIDKFLQTQKRMLVSKKATGLTQIDTSTAIKPVIGELEKNIEIPIFLTGKAEASLIKTPQLLGGLTKTSLKQNLDKGNIEIQKIKEKTSQVEIPKTNIKVETSTKTKQDILLDIAQIGKLKIDTRLESKQVQKPRPLQKSKTTINTLTEPIIKINKKIIPPPIPLPNLAQRLAKKVDTTPDLFEVFVTKGGKDVSIGKTRVKEKAESILGKSLRGTLRAGGFITKGGKPLESKELKLLESPEFRPSKRSKYKVIELREKRLRKGTTGKEIQYFKRKSKRKPKKGGSLFG